MFTQICRRKGHYTEVHARRPHLVFIHIFIKKAVERACAGSLVHNYLLHVVCRLAVRCHIKDRISLQFLPELRCKVQIPLGNHGGVDGAYGCAVDHINAYA